MSHYDQNASQQRPQRSQRSHHGHSGQNGHSSQNGHHSHSSHNPHSTHSHSGGHSSHSSHSGHSGHSGHSSHGDKHRSKGSSRSRDSHRGHRSRGKKGQKYQVLNPFELYMAARSAIEIKIGTDPDKPINAQPNFYVGDVIAGKISSKGNYVRMRVLSANHYKQWIPLKINNENQVLRVFPPKMEAYNHIEIGRSTNYKVQELGKAIYSACLKNFDLNLPRSICLEVVEYIPFLFPIMSVCSTFFRGRGTYSQFSVPFFHKKDHCISYFSSIREEHRKLVRTWNDRVAASSEEYDPSQNRLINSLSSLEARRALDQYNRVMLEKRKNKNKSSENQPSLPATDAIDPNMLNAANDANLDASNVWADETVEEELKRIEDSKLDRQFMEDIIHAKKSELPAWVMNIYKNISNKRFVFDPVMTDTSARSGTNGTNGVGGIGGMGYNGMDVRRAKSGSPNTQTLKDNFFLRAQTSNSKKSKRKSRMEDPSKGYAGIDEAESGNYVDVESRQDRQDVDHPDGGDTDTQDESEEKDENAEQIDVDNKLQVMYPFAWSNHVYYNCELYAVPNDHQIDFTNGEYLEQNGHKNYTIESDTFDRQWAKPINLIATKMESTIDKLIDLNYVKGSRWFDIKFDRNDPKCDMLTSNDKWMVIVGGNWNGDKSRHYFQLTDENMNVKQDVLPMVLINACVSCKFMTELDENTIETENNNNENGGNSGKGDSVTTSKSNGQSNAYQ